MQVIGWVLILLLLLRLQSRQANTNNSQCVQMGCARCERGECLECKWGYQLKEGKCTCWPDSFKPSENKQCSECEVPGCASCSSTNKYECLICMDPAAVLSSSTHICSCENGVLDINGLCSTTCQIFGCVTCDVESSTKCTTCADTYKATIVDGECVCNNERYKLNILGQCEQCVVDACQMCATFDPHTCVRCNMHTTLVDGMCECEEQLVLRNGLCEESQVWPIIWAGIAVGVVIMCSLVIVGLQYICRDKKCEHYNENNEQSRHSGRSNRMRSTYSQRSTKSRSKSQKHYRNTDHIVEINYCERRKQQPDPKTDIRMCTSLTLHV